MSTTPQWNDVMMNNYGTPPLTLRSGTGAWVTDDAGKDYLDLVAGIAVNALGHAHPDIVAAVSQQIARLGHVSNLCASEPTLQVAAALRDKVGDASARVFFCNSGAEANEAAFKLARLTGRRRILAAHGGFHGRTMGSLALTGQPDKQRAFRPLPGGVEFFTYNDIDYLRTLVEQDSADTAAIICEPIQGEVGVVPATPEFLRAARELCDEHGILLIIDEVQTGIGRTGSFFCHQQAGIQPDVITLAKGLGGGLPMGATIARDKAAELFTPGSHGTTFGGNPVVAAAAQVVIEHVDEAFCQRVKDAGAALRERLTALEQVDYVRGQGLLLGVVLNQPLAKKAVPAGYAHGLLLNAPNEHVLRLCPPLVITDADIDFAVQGIAEILGELASEQST
ncbi:acetylornithine transaminase [Corynebacterium sp. HMSC04H06]|uniref:acetylornithine transaminase n=1 Tax=Corynebacterium sp. HMSC04H06 TaxID=1581050 RepID=UPI0008A301FE|nr:acetylornithine transaminase [Corynebacterium sp. HMSC04H06]OFS20109.1 acetylornithine aminotransferase [Corynebacterium sp. HMSC04H06]